MKVACFTVAAMDWFASQQAHFAGGNALNQAIHFSQRGHHTAFAGALGTDEAGNRIAGLLRRRGVDTSLMKRLPGRTASNSLYNDDAGERYGEDGAWQNGVYGEFRLQPDDWEHLAGFDVWSTHANCPDFAETLSRKKQQFLATDFLHLDDLDFLADCLPAVDIAFFGGTPALEAGLARVAERKNALVVLTLGAGGSIAFRGSRYWRQAALPVDQVVDTTGCGDAFQAAFTHAWLTGGRDVQTALEAGAQAGRDTCRHHGALAWD